MLRKNQIAELDCIKIVHAKSLIADNLYHIGRRKFSHRYSSSARQQLHCEGKFDGFVPIFWIDIFYKNCSKKYSNRDISKMTIPETVLMVIFGFSASRAFKRGATLWVYLDFEILMSSLRSIPIFTVIYVLITFFSMGRIWSNFGDSFRGSMRVF